MKRVLMFLLSISSVYITNGQIAKWLIPPKYDDIHMANGGNLIITDSVNQKGIWSLKGKRLAGTSDQIFSFVEGEAVTTIPDSSLITGFFDKEGNHTILKGCNVAYSKPYFSNGYLLVMEGDYYRYVNSKGEIESGQYVKAYPFANGYASCYTYYNLQKKKDPYHLLLTKDYERLSFSYGDKQFDDDDIEFVSSVNDEDIGVVIAKHKIYYFNGKDRSLSPVFARKEESNLKNQAKLEDELSQCITYDSDSSTVIHAKCGKNDRIQIRFNSLLIPVSLSLADGEYIYKKNIVEERSFESPLRMIQEGNKYGICWEDKEILPPQLDKLITCFGDKAFVCLAGKYGMLKIIKDEEFKISINKDNPIAFRHQKYETTIRLDMPKIISSQDTRIDIDSQTGCYIDMTSAEKKDTEFGNYAQYDCVLVIPKSLPDELYGDSRNEISYPTQIIYDGLKSPIIPLKVKAWHYKYFNVDVIDSETLVQQGTLSFTFNINAERNTGEAEYPMNVNLLTDSLQWEKDKISETRYKCKVYELKEGINNIVVQVLEEGCPPTLFPFEIIYTKPSEKTRNKPAVKENVAIKKKTRKTVAPTPHLDI